MIRISQIDDNFSIYKENTVVLLGLGQGTKQLLDLMRYHKIDIGYICDNNKDNWGKILEGIPVVSPPHFQQMAQKENIVVQIAVNNMAKSMDDQLFSIGVKAIISFDEAWNIFSFLSKINLIYTNTDITQNYEIDAEIRPNTYENTPNFHEYVLTNFYKSELIFICMMMKTGDNSIKNTLTKNNISYMIPWHTPEIIDINLLKNLNCKIKITTAVRDPISIDLSVVFEMISNIGRTRRAWFAYFYKYIDILNDGGSVQHMFENMYYKWEKENPISNFMNRFKENILDLSKYPFDKEKGYTIIKEGNIEVFVYQLEKMNDIAKEMSDWIGQTPFDKWVMGNEASGKWIANSYKQAQKEITFSQ